MADTAHDLAGYDPVTDTPQGLADELDAIAGTLRTTGLPSLAKIIEGAAIQLCGLAAERDRAIQLLREAKRCRRRICYQCRESIDDYLAQFS